MTEGVFLAALLRAVCFLSPVQQEYYSDNIVQAVHMASGIDGVALCRMESRFYPRALRREPSGTSWGLFQLYDRYHKQSRWDIMTHIGTGAAFLAECKQGRTFSSAVAVFNGGPHPGPYSLEWGRKVEAERDSLALWLWRKLR